MVGALSFSQPFIISNKFHSATSNNFHLPIPPLLVRKIILTNSTNTSSIHQQLFTSQQSTPKTFSLSQCTLHQGARELGSFVRTNTVGQ